MKAKKNRNQTSEENIVALENYINDFWEFLPVPFCSTNLLGVIIETDKVIAKVLGYSEGEMIGKSLDDFFSEKKKIERLKKECFEKGLLRNREMIVKNKKGEEFPVSVSIMLRRDEKGNPLNYFVAFINISEIKGLQEKLEEKVQERTKELEKARTALEVAKNVLEIRVRARTQELAELAQTLETQVQERTKELQKKMEELEKFNKLAIGRELKMIELKKEIQKLKQDIKRLQAKL